MIAGEDSGASDDLQRKNQRFKDKMYPPSGPKQAFFAHGDPNAAKLERPEGPLDLLEDDSDRLGALTQSGRGIATGFLSLEGDGCCS